MMTKREVHEMVCEALGRELDPALERFGFQRHRRSVEYVRPVPDGEQRLCFFSENRPSDEPLAWARLHPQIRLSFAEVNRIACELVGGQTGWIAGGDWTFTAPVDLVIPREFFTRWFIGDDRSIDSCLQSIWVSLETWIMPFLDEYSSIESFTVAYENADQRFVWSHPLCLFVTAALIQQGQIQKAAAVLETKMGKPGVRARYAMAFDYVDKLNCNGQ
jgi:hypothetical protein